MCEVKTALRGTCYTPVIQSNSLDCIDAVIKLIPSSEHDTKATTSKTRLLMKVCEISGHSSRNNCSSRKYLWHYVLRVKKEKKILYKWQRLAHGNSCP